MSLFTRLSTALGLSEAPARGRRGMRVYAVGDIHGRLDLLDELLALIEADVAAAPSARNFLVCLGDYVDRGPESAGVIARLQGLDIDAVEPVFLAGNHEEIMLDVLAAKPGMLESWLQFGGSACAQSYGADVRRLAALDEERGAALLRKHVPREHIAFLKALGDTFRFGDFLFVHAGIRPGVPLEDQVPDDLRWIREPFLTDSRRHEFVVVHGHTISDGVQNLPNRIGIDTGAYRTGILTAVVVEADGTRRFIATTPR